MTTASKRTTPKKPKPPIVDGFLAELAAGCYDDDLVRLANAVGERFRDAGVRTYWKLTFAGTTWTEETVTSGERAFVEELITATTGRPFSYLEIDPKLFIGHAIALVVAHLHKVDGIVPSKAVEMAEAIPEPEWQKVIDVYQKSASLAVAGSDTETS